jgi:putative flippase GtrA
VSGRLATYTAISLAMFVLDLGAFALAVRLGVHYLIANSLIFAALSLVQFEILRRTVFTGRGGSYLATYAAFLATCVLALAVQNGVLYALVGWAEFPAVAAKAIAVVVAFAAIYRLRLRLFARPGASSPEHQQ